MLLSACADRCFYRYPSAHSVETYFCIRADLGERHQERAQKRVPAFDSESSIKKDKILSRGSRTLQHGVSKTFSHNGINRTPHYLSGCRIPHAQSPYPSVTILPLSLPLRAEDFEGLVILEHQRPCIACEATLAMALSDALGM